MTAYRAKEQGLAEINGTEEESYDKMPEYCEDLKRNNPGSTIALECSTEEAGISRFKRVFICFGASAMGFQFCRPILGLDGTHLKSKYRGMHFFYITNLKVFCSLPLQQMPMSHYFPWHMLL